MLTQEQLDILKQPFEPRDVSFVRGFAYGTEDAIADRIEMVDPSWTFERLSIEARDKYVVATFRLTICGVWRDGVGMEKLDSQADPDKSAATDALKRAARLFGIGRYFQGLPSSVKDDATYTKWYKTSVGTPTQPAPQTPQNAPPASAPAPAVSNTPQAAENGGNGVANDIVKLHWNELIKGVKNHSFNGVKPSGQEIANTINKMNNDENAFAGMTTYQQMLATVIHRINSHYEKAS